ncbi:hypothetical protein FE810_08665 [Thalassotalea litorea]|uniref:Signal protein PDZ n=1 Tax=Thalassotalea litorea TaxID=2020715 RepID=A0A5R9ITT6_9GAMM|nr:hypothetical protein [Thalassotalea litorea]TLU65348.1 hypothetical protein FE810_08665 [Thalassotalea litorea]
MFLTLLIVFTTVDKAQAQWQPFELVNGKVVIDIHLNGIPAKAIIDSGQNFHAISTDFSERYPENLKVERNKGYFVDISGPVKTPVFTSVKAKLFGADLELQYIPKVNINDADFILGLSFFKGLILQIDYPNKRLQMVPRSAIDLKSVANIEMRPEQNSTLPAIKVQVNGESTWVVLDTGYEKGLFLKRNFVIDNNLVESDVEKVEINSLTDSFYVEQFSINTLNIANYELENILSQIPLENQAAHIYQKRSRFNPDKLKRGVKTSGKLGYDVLKHFILTIDFKHYNAHLWAG